MSDPISRQDALRRRYDRYPYPGYPLWTRLRWQEGYLASPAFAAAVAGTVPWRLRAHGKVAVLGCGDTFAEGFNAWLRPCDRVDYVDFSAVQLRRSAVRTAFSLTPHRYHHSSAEDFVSEALSASYHHIEAFGVLHHCPDPAAILRHCARLLAPGGTMRMMVYNSPARARVHAIQDYAERQGWLQAATPPIAELKRWLAKLADEVPGFEDYHDLSKVKVQELVDGLLNPLEQRIAPSAWCRMVADAGLAVAGLFDRYSQLEHLPNPLTVPPEPAQMDALAARGTLSQNLEFYLRKPCDAHTHSAQQGPIDWSLTLRWGLRRYALSLPTLRPPTNPKALSRRRQWRHLLDFLWFGLKPPAADYEPLSDRQCSELARLGWLLPGMITRNADAAITPDHPPAHDAPYDRSAFARIAG